MAFVIDNLWLFGLALISGGALIWPLLLKGQQARRLSPAEVVHRLNREQAQLIDIRNAEQFAQGHIAQARSLPQPSATEVDAASAKLPGINKGRPLVVVAQDDRQAQQALRYFTQAGVSEVFWLGAGMLAWEQAGLPIVARSLPLSKAA